MVKIARILFVFFTVMMVLSSCDNGKSYADLLKEEDKAVKAFLADKKVEDIPADSVFVTLQDVGNNDTLAVPYYRLDDDGNVYMQVLDAGIQDDRFGETTLSSTTQYGTGIQYPMYFLGNECKVNLLIRAKLGFTAETSTVIPYLYTISYNKSK